MSQQNLALSISKEKIARDRADFQARRKSKTTTAKLELLERQEQNIGAWEQWLKEKPILGTYVTSIANDTGKVGVIRDQKEEFSIIEFVGEEKPEPIDISLLMIDQVLSDLCPWEHVLVAGAQYQITNLIYPGKVEVSELGIRDDWEVVSAQEPDWVEIDRKIRGDFLFLMFEGGGKFKSELLQKNEVIVSKVSTDYHECRSAIVKQWHIQTKTLKAGIRIDFDPWFLAFPPENKAIYHPEIQEGVEDIVEDIKSGVGIITRIGVSTEGEIWSGNRRTLAALLTDQNLVPIEIREFEIRADFIEALLNANKQRIKTNEMMARERQYRINLCSEEAKKNQRKGILNLKNISRETAEKIERETKKQDKQENAQTTTKKRTTPYDRAVEDENISGRTAEKQQQVIKFLDTCKDKELVRKIRTIFNRNNKTDTCIKIIALGKEDAHQVADLIINNEVRSVEKALARIKPNTTFETKKAVASKSTGGKTAIKGEILPQLPKDLMKKCYELLGEIDVDVLSGIDKPVAAHHHLTGTIDDLDGMKIDWVPLSKEKGAVFFGNFTNVSDPIAWAKRCELQFYEKNIASGVAVFCNPSASIRNIMKEIASAVVDITNNDFLQVNKVPVDSLVFYYFGNDFFHCHNLFKAIADVRLAAWLFTQNEQLENADWVETKTGYRKIFYGKKYEILSSDDSDCCYTLLENGKILNAFPDVKSAKSYEHEINSSVK